MRLFPAVVLALLFGCKDGSRKVNPKADARAFAESLATEVIPACDPTKLEPRLATSRIPDPDKALAARLLCEWFQGIHSYKFVGFKKGDAEPDAQQLPNPIMRRLLLDPQTGAMFVVYDELVLLRPAKSTELRLVDVFSYRQAVWLSDLLDANRSSTGEPTNYLGASAKHEVVMQAHTQLRNGDREGALATLDQLEPAILKRERGVQMLRVRIAAGSGGDVYKEVLAQFGKVFEDDPKGALTAIDGALDINDYDGAIRWIDLLEKTIGVDAFLEGMRVIALTRKGDLDKARAAANAAVALEPTLTRAHEIKLDVLIAKKQWPEALAVMTELETNHGQHFDVDKLRAEPRLAELVQSPTFAEWVTTRSAPQ